MRRGLCDDSDPKDRAVGERRRRCALERGHGEDIVRAAARKRISRRTVNEAKKNIAGIVSRKVGTKWMWSIQNEDCNIAEVSSDEE